MFESLDHSGGNRLLAMAAPFHLTDRIMNVALLAVCEQYKVADDRNHQKNTQHQNPLNRNSG